MWAIWRLALDSGVRRRELVELSWSDVDLERGMVTIRHRKQRTVRTVVLCASTVSALRALARRQAVDASKAGDTWVGGGPGATGRVVVGRAGQPIPATTLTKVFRRAQRDIDVPSIPFHGLRHTFVRNAITGGAPVGTIAERLGYVDVASAFERWMRVLDVDSPEEPEEDDG